MSEVLDVMIVGAGISGISSAYHLNQRCPKANYKILEARAGMGGTWDLFRYPGIRSDSDMHTMGFSFRPWTHPMIISPGKEIREYIEETADENGITPKIQFGHKLLSAHWSHESGTWHLVAETTGKKKVKFECRFLHMCNGYYNYDEGYLPEFKGYSDFEGDTIHPQKWPQDYDYSGKKVVIIGSGATAVTLLPAMAEKTEHITMLQRSPTYMVSRPAIDGVASFLRKILGSTIAYKLIRFRNILMQMLMWRMAKKKPEKFKQTLLDLAEETLGKEMVEKHFTPTYAPWDQRLCLVPDNDFFECIKEGKADVVTDEIDSFVKDGIKLKSGEVLKADLIVTATGLRMQILQNIDFKVGKEKVVVKDRMVYKGCMLNDVPNMAFSMGYSNASWTLKADLTSAWVCRLLNHLNSKGYDYCVAETDAEVTAESVMNLNSGYVQRAQDFVPKQGSVAPWKLNHNYALDSVIMAMKSLDDGVLKCGKATAESESSSGSSTQNSDLDKVKKAA